MRQHPVVDRFSVIAMARSGHTAVANWLVDCWGIQRKPVEELNLPFPQSLANIPKGPFALVIRSYPNWAASVVRKYPSHNEDKLTEMIMAWTSQASHALTVPTILFDPWCSAGLGAGVAGAPSSFDLGSPLNRHTQVQHNPRWQWMMTFSDALKESERLFGRHVTEECLA